MTEQEAWVPKTREDWTGIFRDGLGEFVSAREEADAKAAAAKAEEGGEGDKGETPKKTFAERLLGL